MSPNAVVTDPTGLVRECLSPNLSLMKASLAPSVQELEKVTHSVLSSSVLAVQLYCLASPCMWICLPFSRKTCMESVVLLPLPSLPS
mmetsp:Transcript_37031/g.96015  ORF Transcript_37031/g.96015 Transcript_37031/m.96015 type:complete len:87 (-) Transcript_37031:98-358(-)